LEVNGLDVSTIKEFAKKFKLTANTWTDVGIRYDDLETGTYIMQVEMNDANPQNAQYGEKISGILTWYGLPTNGADADIIPVSKSGHSRNGHDIQLRTLRTLSSDAGVLKLQIMDTANWNMESNVVFRFKRLI
jgi:hypothetical protein